MSAVPQKKMCWNCEGSVDRDVDNCSYCGVYLHGTEEGLPRAPWSPAETSASSNSTHSTEEIPETITPLQSTHLDFHAHDFSHLFNHLKQELFPLLFLMLGSIFFLFGVVLFLFSQNGTLTLQWKEESALYFLIFAFPLLSVGWILLQRIDPER